MKTSKTCPHCKRAFVARVLPGYEQFYCSLKCSMQARSIAIGLRDRTCTLCKRLLPSSRFDTKGGWRRGKKSRCKDCLRVLFRAAYSIGKYTKNGSRPHRENDPLKRKARNLLQSAVKAGRIVRQPCIVCGLAESDGHHRDYRRPYDVIWLCRRHHALTHRQTCDTPFTEEAAIRALKSARQAEIPCGPRDKRCIGMQDGLDEPMLCPDHLRQADGE